MMADPALMSLRCICKRHKTFSAEKLPFTSLNLMLLCKLICYHFLDFQAIKSPQCFISHCCVIASLISLVCSLFCFVSRFFCFSCKYPVAFSFIT